ncbi:hypothetical protein [Rhodoferax sp.]|uniref:hypothetical protein n=1 Tax=Rhodoferax sp. TaxID=50421 RepID=UPI00374D6667
MAWVFVWGDGKAQSLLEYIVADKRRKQGYNLSKTNAWVMAHPQAAVLRIFRQPPCRGQHQQPGKASSAVFLEGGVASLPLMRNIHETSSTFELAACF